jgi:hypothetical protein
MRKAANKNIRIGAYVAFQRPSDSIPQKSCGERNVPRQPAVLRAPPHLRTWPYHFAALRVRERDCWKQSKMPTIERQEVGTYLIPETIKLDLDPATKECWIYDVHKHSIFGGN